MVELENNILKCLRPSFFELIKYKINYENSKIK